MIAEIRAPKSTNVVLLLVAPSWTPRPMALPPSALATIGLMMASVKALIKVLKASAMTRPTATTMTSARMRKFLSPVSIPRTFLTVPRAERGLRAGPVRPSVEDDDIVPDQAKVKGHARPGCGEPNGHGPHHLRTARLLITPPGPARA